MSSLLEREVEQNAICRTLERVSRDGVGSVLLLRGEPGFGKTRLLQCAAAQAEDRFVVVRALGHEVEQAYPFALIHQIIESLVHTEGAQASGLAQMSHSLRLLLQRSVQARAPGDHQESPARSELVFAFYWFLSSLSELRPLVLALDDLQWSDPDSLEAVRFLAWRLNDLPIAMVAGLRPWPPAAGELADRLQREGKATVRELRPLSLGGTTELLSSTAGWRPLAGMVREVQTLTRGNPFLVEQMGLVLKEGFDVPRPDPQLAAATAARPVVLARLSWLPPESMRFLQAASVLGTEWRLDLALELAAVAPGTEPSVREPAERLGLCSVRPDGRADFVHPLVRSVLYDGLDPVRRQTLHMRAADLLRAQGARATELAPHLAAAARPGDRLAFDELCRAAGEAWAVAAYESAAIHLRHALRIALPGPDRARTLFELGRAYQRVGSHHLAMQALEEAAGEECPAELRCRIHQSWGLALALCGEADAAFHQFDEAVAAVRDLDPALAAETAAARTILEVTTRGVGQAKASGQEALGLADASGSPRARAKAFAAWGQVLFLSGDHRAARQFALDANRDLPEDSVDEIEQIWGWCPRIQLGMIDLRTERYQEAEAVVREQLRRAQARRELPASIWASTFLAELEWRRGRLRDAFRWCGDGLELPDDIPWATAQAHAVRGFVLMDMGDFDGAAAAFARAAENSGRAGRRSVLLLCRLGSATIAARRGQLDTAFAAFQEILAISGDIALASHDLFHLGREAAEVFVRVGAHEEAHRLIRVMLSEAPADDRPGPRAAALRCLGLHEAQRGREAETERAMTAALLLHARADDQLERGRTLLAYGSWLRRAGQPKRARPVLAEATQVFESCGAMYWHPVAEAERRAAGGRRRRRPHGGRLSLLTPQEYRIVEFVAQGYSNRQIAYDLRVSPKTLETHLSHIYLKLEVPSRADLRELFARLGGFDAADEPRGG